ncbi:MAG TPA: hypothetical protein VN046_10625 [Stenotrophobium sp.]|jgi:hypothetical protein|nr:hypothetical protein [Stenotrophobium sp.]
MPSSLRVWIRRIALFDLLITAPLALPVLNAYVVAWLFSGFGLSGAPQDWLPLPLSAALFCSLAGLLGILWNGCRALRPDDALLIRADACGRCAVAAVLAYYLLACGAPGVLWLFVASELGGAIVEGLALARARQQ